MLLGEKSDHCLHYEFEIEEGLKCHTQNRAPGSHSTIGLCHRGGLVEPYVLEPCDRFIETTQFHWIEIAGLGGVYPAPDSRQLYVEATRSFYHRYPFR